MEAEDSLKCSKKPGLPPIHILSQMNLIHTHTHTHTHTYTYTRARARAHKLIHLILSCHPCIGLPFSVPNQNFVRISRLPQSRYMPNPYNSPWFDHHNNMCESHTNYVTSHYATSSIPVTPVHLDQNVLQRNLISNTLNLCSSFNVRVQVSYAYKTTGYTAVFIL
jgi:hypothetical protein